MKRPITHVLLCPRLRRRRRDALGVRGGGGGARGLVPAEEEDVLEEEVGHRVGEPCVRVYRAGADGVWSAEGTKPAHQRGSSVAQLLPEHEFSSESSSTVYVTV